MGFERDEVPSRVEGSALVGLGKAQNSRKRFSPKAKSSSNKPRSPQTGFERDEVPSRVEGSALVGLGKAQKPRKRFSPKAKSSSNKPRNPRMDISDQLITPRKRFS